MTTSSYYTQKDFENIIDKGVSYTIPQEIIHLIQQLDNTTKTKTALQNKNYETRHNGQKINQRNNDRTQQQNGPQGWKRCAENDTIKITCRKIVEKEGREKIVQQCKLCLNKLSKTNFPTQSKEIQEHLEELHDIDEPQVFQTVLEDIFQIISRSIDPTMSKLTADLYQLIYAQFEEPAKQVIDAKIAEWKNAIMDVRTIDANNDNDAYCEYQKLVVERRGKSVFWVQLCKNNLLTMSQGIDLLDFLLQMAEKTATNTEENRKVFLEEFTENLFQMYINGHEYYQAGLLWGSIIERIRKLSEMSNKEYPNMTSRAKFKFKDLVEGRF